jgi:hypothetical protein
MNGWDIFGILMCVIIVGSFVGALLTGVRR